MLNPCRQLRNAFIYHIAIKHQLYKLMIRQACMPLRFCPRPEFIVIDFPQFIISHVLTRQKDRLGARFLNAVACEAAQEFSLAFVEIHTIKIKDDGFDGVVWVFRLRHITNCNITSLEKCIIKR